MQVSVFTPTHKPTYLQEVWNCLKRQTFTDWEWVVVPNGAMRDPIAAQVKAMVNGDSRVRVMPYPLTTSLPGVGMLKKYACDQCFGDIFVEYDHDDIIVDDCLEAVVKAANNSSGPAFIYSDSVTASFDGTSHIFMPEYGWRQHEWEHEGKKYTINDTFPVNPRSLCEILYAPDHVRAWTRTAYKTTGGHNPALVVGDDHELIVRTYLKGIHFEYIARPLYIHRLEPQTTSQTNLPKIQEISHNIRDKYLHELIREWCNRWKLPMLDLGGGHGCPPNFIPVDPCLPLSGAIQANNGLAVWPEGIKADVFELETILADNSVGCFRASDFFEHIPIGKVIPLMNLLYRKLVPGGFIISNTPAVCDDEGRCGRGAYQDPDHKSFWSSNNFWYWTDRKYVQYENGLIQCRFQTVRVANYYPSDWHRTHLIPYVLWDAMALKDDDKNYFPGPRNI